MDQTRSNGSREGGQMWQREEGKKGSRAGDDTSAPGGPRGPADIYGYHTYVCMLEVWGVSPTGKSVSVLF